MTVRPKDQPRAVAVLASGGVESAALICEALRRGRRVYPIFVREGLVWETVEMAHLKRLLGSLRANRLMALTVLEAPLAQVYRPHWSLGKGRVPGSKASDASVYLPGRNLLLLSLAGLFCGVRKIPSLWIGTLKGNPFRDAAGPFRLGVERLLRASLAQPVRIAAPFREMTKGQVIRHCRGVAWEKTFSCLDPARGRHCGRCQKCAERKKGFQEAGMKDSTRYAR
jgi:7-cyano-7-deazaguanine synthase